MIGLESDPEVALSPKSNVVRFENPKADALSNSSAAPVDAASASSPAPKERAPDPRSVSLVLAGDPGNLKGTVQSAPQVIEPEAETEKADTPQEATAVEPNAPVEAGTPLGTFFKFFFLTISSSVALLWYTIASTGRYFVRHPFHVLLNLAMIVALALGVVTGSEIHSKMILGRSQTEPLMRLSRGRASPASTTLRKSIEMELAIFLEWALPDGPSARLSGRFFSMHGKQGLTLKTNRSF